MRLSGHDASFLYTETASGPMHGISFSLLDGPATFQEIFDYTASRIHLIPRFRQKLALVPFNVAHPKWVDDPDFDLKNHIKPHEVKSGTTLQEAIDIGLKLGEPLLDRTRPLWLNYVIENVEGRTLLIQMAHHAFVDGATAVALSTILTDASPDAPPPPPPDTPWNPDRPLSSTELWREALVEQAQGMSKTLTGMMAGGGPSRELAGNSTDLMNRMARPVMQAPWNAGLVGPKRKLATLTVPLVDFKPIRSAFGGTVNDVVVAVAVEAAARYMGYLGENTENQYLRLMCPVDVRGEGDDPLHMGGNRVSGMFPILAAWPMTMGERYEEVRTEMQGIKERREPEMLDALQQSQMPVPPVVLGATLGVGTPFDPTLINASMPQPVVPGFGQRPLQTGFNFTCTNVPGPNWTQYVAGYEVLSSYGTLMLGGNLGLGIGVVSYDGNMTFCITADPRLVKDVARLRDFIGEAFEELSALGVST